MMPFEYAVRCDGVKPIRLGMPGVEPTLAIGWWNSQIFVFEKTQRKPGSESQVRSELSHRHLAAS